jgi:hypothetical protein
MDRSVENENSPKRSLSVTLLVSQSADLIMEFAQSKLVLIRTDDSCDSRFADAVLYR